MAPAEENEDQDECWLLLLLGYIAPCFQNPDAEEQIIIIKKITSLYKKNVRKFHNAESKGETSLGAKALNFNPSWGRWSLLGLILGIKKIRIFIG